MNIIIEGPDGSGKSTLAAFIANALDWKIVTSPGPAKTRDELNERVHACLWHNHSVFDRHPCISERVYGTIRGDIKLNAQLEARFYSSPSNIIVYFRGPRTLSNHKLKEHDVPEHVAMLKANHERICDAYDAWALDYAQLIYRRDESKLNFVKLIQGRMS